MNPNFFSFFRSLACGASLLLMLTPALQAAVPQLLNHQGRIAVDGINFDGNGQFKFALVNSTGNTTFWSNDGTSNAGGQPTAAVSLSVVRGLYSVLLGDASLPNMTAVPASVFANTNVRLRVWFNDGSHGFQLISPDQRLAASPYALVAENAALATSFSGSLAGDVTGTQSATSIAASTVTGKLLTGLSPVAGNLSADDTILDAFNKLDGSNRLKANLNSPTFTGTVGGITASMVGLGSVTNTSDADKPVSTAQQTALDLKAPLSNPSFTGTVSGSFSGPLNGNATTATDFSGSLAGDVTGNQTTTVISATTVTGKALTGYSSAAGTITATDTILGAINKLNGNNALKANLASPTFTGTVRLPTGTASAAPLRLATGVSLTTPVFGSVEFDGTNLLLTNNVGSPTRRTIAFTNAPTFTGTTSGTFSGPLTGDVTGNVTGNVSGSAASFTGSLSGDVTGNQGTTSISATTVTGKVLTNYASAAGTITATDTILSAINKLNGNNALKANLASPTFTGTVVLPTGTASAAPLRLATGVSLTTPVFGSVEFDGTNLLLTNNSVSPTRKTIAFTDAPTFTGVPLAPTAASGTNTGQIATTEFVQSAIQGVVGAAPAALDTLNELAEALNDDASYASTITTALSLKAPIANPTFTGTVSGTFSGPLTGDVTGNVTGNVSGSAASFTGSLSGDVTGNQGTTSISATTVTGKVLTNYASAAGTITATDTILGAINKLNGNNALKANLASPTFTGTVVLPTGTASAAPLRLATGVSLTTPVFGSVEFDGTNLLLTNNVGSPTRKTLAFTDAPTFTGVPVAPTAASGTNTGQIATTEFVQSAIQGVVGAAPAALDTLNELAEALNDDASYASTITTALSLKAPIANPTFTGTVSGITASMVGLGNVSNTSDANKPVSTAQQTALDLKAPLASPTFTGTVNGITKSMVGLANVDNTTDANKPVSTAQQTALGLKANLASPTFTGTVVLPTGTALAAPLRLATGVSLTTPAFGSVEFDGTNLLLTNNSGNPTRKTIAFTDGITKSMVGLANVDNTTDANKPVSTAQQTALDLKASLASPTFTGTVNGITKSMVGLANVDNTTDANKPVSTAQQTALGLKANLASPTFTGTVVLPTGTALAAPLRLATGVSLTTPAFGSVEFDGTNLLLTNNVGSPTRKTLAFTDAPTFTGVPVAPTAASGTNTGQIATTEFVQSAIQGVVGAAPAALDTLNELAEALNDDASYASTITTALSLKAPIANPTFTGVPVAPTASTGTNTGQIANTEFVQSAIQGVLGTAQTALDLKAPLANPTFTGTVSGITRSMVGLGNVSNTSDANKPVSSAQQDALDLKAPLASPTFTGTVSGITKSMVGLSNVANTSDANKPISTAQQDALDLKAPLASPTFTGTVGGITKSMVGLGNVANTSDANKPISTAQQDALDLKAPLASPTFTGTVGGITKSMVGLGSVNNTSDANKPVSSAQQDALDLKAPLASPTFTGTVRLPTGTASVAPLRLTAGINLTTPVFGSVEFDGTNLLLTNNVGSPTRRTIAFTNAPTFTGVPLAPTAASGTNTGQIATTEFVQSAIQGVVGAAPAALDTLNELAEALNDDASYASTITTALSLKAPIANPTFTGTVSGTFSGPLTGDVTGNVSGSAASFTGSLSGDVTGNQGTTSISATTVTGKVLTNYASAAGTITATDTILGAINKLNGNNALKANLASPTFTGTVVLPTGTASAAPLRLATGVSLTTPVFGSVEFDGTNLLLTNNVGSPTRRTIAFTNAPTFTGTTSGTFSGPLTGDVTGNVTGNVSGSAASFTGSLSGDVTGNQGTTSISATTVTGKVLTNYASAAGTITATDTILGAINKLNGNNALKANLASPTFTGTVVLPTGTALAAPLRLATGVSLTTPAFGSVEFDGTNLFLTTNSGSPTRKTLAFTDSVPPSVPTSSLTAAPMVPVLAWGNNSNGQTTMPALANVAAVAAGESHSLVLLDAGTVIARGLNTSGQVTVPASLTGVTDIAAGTAHNLVRKSDGTLVAWGDNSYGQTTIPSGITTATRVAAGEKHSLALLANGSVRAWGDNSFGQTNLPASLTGATITAIAAGYDHSLALKSDGTVIAWGRDDAAQVTLPSGLVNVVAIAAGAFHSLALKGDGTVIAWGWNDAGQVTVPAGLSGVSKIAGGYAFSMALKNDGTLVLWGDNSDGQTTVPATATQVTHIAAGASHAMALRADAIPAQVARLDQDNVFTGKVGIKRTPAVNSLEVEGSASKTTAGSWLSNSDRRIKTEIESITGALEKLDQVRLVDFRYTDEYRAAHPSIEDVRYPNVIAQEFAEVFPADVKSSGEVMADGSPILQVDTYPLIIYSAAAVQELNQENQMLKKQLADQEKRLRKLEALLGE